MEESNHRQFVSHYRWQKDTSKPRRRMYTVKVGEVYVSRLLMEPGVMAGQLYHKNTNVILFITRGLVRLKFVAVEGAGAAEMLCRPGYGIIHQPPGVALALKNEAEEESVVVFFSDRQLRSEDDYPYDVNFDAAEQPLTMKVARQPVTHYTFRPDRSKPGRLLESVKVGGVYVSRLTIQPGVVTGNVYHKNTKLILFVTKGRARFKFKQVETGEEKELMLEPGSGIIHVPPYVAIGDQNIAKTESVVVYFSDHPFRLADDYDYKIY